MIKKKRFISILCSALLIAFTAYVLMDTFVITKVYANVEVAEINVIGNSIGTHDDTENAESSTDISLDEINGSTAIDEEYDIQTDRSTEYSDDDNTNTFSSTQEYVDDSSDEDTSVDIQEYYVNDTKVYVASITLSSSTDLKTALAENAYGKNVTSKTSEIASENNALLAINGDYYGSRNSGYVVRNGVIYRDVADDDREDLVIYTDGSYEIINESETSLYDLDTERLWQVFSFGPALINEGEISVVANEEVGKAMASNPRTAIGIIDESHYVFVVSDGRTDESEGLSLSELAEFMQSLGVTTAYNLDGGGSSTMYYNGDIVNNPTTNGNKIKERDVSDIVYISF